MADEETEAIPAMPADWAAGSAEAHWAAAAGARRAAAKAKAEADAARAEAVAAKAAAAEAATYRAELETTRSRLALAREGITDDDVGETILTRYGKVHADPAKAPPLAAWVRAARESDPVVSRLLAPVATAPAPVVVAAPAAPPPKPAPELPTPNPAPTGTGESLAEMARKRGGRLPPEIIARYLPKK
jgi:hypothetical protein